MSVMVALESASVFLDFDGTITEHDVGDYVAERLVPGQWQELDAQYQSGAIGSRECLLDTWELLPNDRETVLAVAREVQCDPGLEPFVTALRAASAEVTVVSDGFGFTVAQVCKPLGIPFLTNHVDWTTGRLEFPHEDRCCPCTSCGVCKQAPIKDAQHRGRTTVLIGDGTSDRKAALLADVVFAKGALAVWCDAFEVPYEPFTTLGDVHAALLGASV